MKENGRVFYVIGTVLLLCAELAIAWFVHDNVVRPYVGDVLVTVLLCCFCRLGAGNRIYSEFAFFGRRCRVSAFKKSVYGSVFAVFNKFQIPWQYHRHAGGDGNVSE